MDEPVSIYESAKLHPFGTLEALQEHIGALRVVFGVRRVESVKPKIGTTAYHVDAAEDYAAALFQALVLLLPEIWKRDEGDRDGDH
jgi:hypothetical protein